MTDLKPSSAEMKHALKENAKDFAATASPHQKRSAGEQDQKYQQEQHMHLEGEKLHASKRREQIGEVTLRKHVVSEKETIEVPLMHEEVVIERRSFSGEHQPLGDETVIHIPVSAEQVEITKDRVILGDVVITKRQVQENKQFTETCQHEEARLDHEGDIPYWEANADKPGMQPGAR